MLCLPSARHFILLNFAVDLGTLFKPTHPFFLYSWLGFAVFVTICFVVLQRHGLSLLRDHLSLWDVSHRRHPSYLLCITFDSNRACVDCGLCTQYCPTDFSPREMDFKDARNGGSASAFCAATASTREPYEQQGSLTVALEHR